MLYNGPGTPASLDPWGGTSVVVLLVWLINQPRFVHPAARPDCFYAARAALFVSETVQNTNFFAELNDPIVSRVNARRWWH
jgi:hypothetical protein